VLASLADELRGMPGFFWQSWMQAANYVLTHQLDAEQGLAWVERSIGVDENVVNLSLKSRLLRAAGRNAEADETLARAEGLAASESEVNNLGYVYLQGGEVAKAIEVFERNVREHPGSWNVYDSLAEAQATAGRTSEAIANYEKARGMAPEAQHTRIDVTLAQLRGE
jgi:predicted Zn-dependent protease